MLGPRADGGGKLFAFVADDHPLRPALDRFDAEVRRRTAVSAFAPRRCTVRADLKAAAIPGEPRIASLYWSMQREEPGRFAASTLAYSAATATAEWLEFPHDPRLPAAAEYLERHPGAEVLRYIPLRRMTMRVGGAGAAATVVKVKRRSRFGDAWRCVQVVEALIAEARPGFDVPRALGVDEHRCLYVQEAMPGRSLAALVDEHTAPRLLARLGALHRELHGIPAPALPRRDVDVVIEQARASAAWIGYAMPALRDPVSRVADAIRHSAPPAAAPAFCHGDPDCGQVVVEGDRWSLLDFDACHAGDSYRDVAMLAASLDYHVPRLRAVAESDSPVAEHVLDGAAEAYLDSYFAGGAREWARLAWHRACAELFYLALALAKDRYHARAFSRRWRRLEAHAAALVGVARR